MKLTASAIAAVLVGAFAVLAQETNSYPKSRLELFESATSTILIKGTDDIGVVAGKAGGVTVKCRETKDVSTGQREFGVIVTVTQGDGAEDTTVVDYDELEALLRGIDYTAKWNGPLLRWAILKRASPQNQD